MAFTVHTIPPVFDASSEILILGSFPSVKSREAGFFYGHPQNRFWKTIAAVFADDVPETTEKKKHFLLRHHIALWDVVASCEIDGSADSAIRNVVPNDISAILQAAQIRQIFVNGKTAEKYYNRFLLPQTGRAAVCLPSTSPANATKKLDMLIAEWSALIREADY